MITIVQVIVIDGTKHNVILRVIESKVIVIALLFFITIEHFNHTKIQLLYFEILGLGQASCLVFHMQFYLFIYLFSNSGDKMV